MRAGPLVTAASVVVAAMSAVAAAAVAAAVALLEAAPVAAVVAVLVEAPEPVGQAVRVALVSVGPVAGQGGPPGIGRGASVGADALSIQMLDGGVQIADSRGVALVLKTDREWYEVGERREIQAFWKKAKLVTRNRGRGEALFIQEYSINKKGQLVVLNQIQFGGDGGTASYKRFYDRKESG